jgi:hypothetical protein
VAEQSQNQHDQHGTYRARFMDVPYGGNTCRVCDHEVAAESLAGTSQCPSTANKMSANPGVVFSPFQSRWSSQMSSPNSLAWRPSAGDQKAEHVQLRTLRQVRNRCGGEVRNRICRHQRQADCERAAPALSGTESLNRSLMQMDKATRQSQPDPESLL